MTVCCSIRIAWRLEGLTTICPGTNPDYPTYVAIKGTVFDVTGNKAYGPDGSYKGELYPRHTLRQTPAHTDI